MADVQLEHGFLRLANVLASAVAVAPWDTAAQPRMVMALIRVTFGMNRRTADVGTADWRTLTRLSDRHLKQTKKALQDAGVFELVRDFDARTQTPQRWRLQKDYSKWGRLAPDIAGAEKWVRAALSQMHSGAPGESDDPRCSPIHPVRQPVPDPVSQPVPGPVNQAVPGSGSQALGQGDVSGGKTGNTGKTNETSDADRDPVRELWDLYVDEMGAGQMKLNDRRRTLLSLLHSEQLEGEEDPLRLFRATLQAVQASHHHMSKRAYHEPDSLFLNQSRRERWTNEGRDRLNGRTNGNGRDPLLLKSNELWEMENAGT